VEDAQASGLSYEVGSGTLLDGLDEALLGMPAGESKTFSTELAGGEHGGEQADVTVTVHSVKIKELPELDDEFAQSASEFDTLGELRAGTRTQLEAVKRMQQARQARDRALDAVLAKVDIPLPDALVQGEIDARRANLDEQLERAGTTREAYLQSSGQTGQQLEADMTEGARKSVKAGFVLDQLAQNEDLNVEQDELNSYVIEQAYRMGVQPDRLAQEITEHGQIGSVVADVLRGKALNLITERVAVTDDAGKPVDVSAALRPDTAEGEAEAAGEAAAETGTAEAEAELAAEADAEAAAEAAAEAGAEPVAEAAPAVDADGADQDETPKKKATRKAAKK
jgi:trigger factor